MTAFMNAKYGSAVFNSVVLPADFTPGATTTAVALVVSNCFEYLALARKLICPRCASSSALADSIVADPSPTTSAPIWFASSSTVIESYYTRRRERHEHGASARHRH